MHFFFFLLTIEVSWNFSLPEQSMLFCTLIILKGVSFDELLKGTCYISYYDIAFFQSDNIMQLDNTKASYCFFCISHCTISSVIYEPVSDASCSRLPLSGDCISDFWFWPVTAMCMNWRYISISYKNFFYAKMLDNVTLSLEKTALLRKLAFSPENKFSPYKKFPRQIDANKHFLTLNTRAFPHLCLCDGLNALVPESPLPMRLQWFLPNNRQY